MFTRLIARRVAGSTSRIGLREVPRMRLARFASSNAPRTFFTDTERENDKLLVAVDAKMTEFRTARDTVSESATVSEKIARAKTLKALGPLAEVYERYDSLRRALQDLQPHLSDPDESVRELFASERDDLMAELDEALIDLPPLLLPPAETDPLPAMISLNAGVGGSESALFVEEMSRVYQRFAERNGWKVEIISKTDGPGTGRVGIREITMKFDPPPYSDDDAKLYGLIKWEKGVHRVQRVPATETQGRLHTSTITAVVMPIFPDVEDSPLVDPKDVKTETMRSRGAGGQHVNKTESAIRLTHLPTGISVSMQDSRSQHQNRAWAWDILRARLSEKKHQEEVDARRASRQSQVKSADRSDKVRTYNFGQDRITDHRIGLSTTGLKDFFDGDGLDYLIQALQDDLNKRRLESIIAGEGDCDE